MYTSAESANVSVGRFSLTCANINDHNESFW